MKASKAGYGELTDRKVKGISNGLKLKRALAYKPLGVPDNINKTSTLVEFILTNHIEGIKPEMHS